MRKDGTLLLILLALALAGLGMMSLSARGATADYYDYASRPKSAQQIVMASRTTAAADSGGNGLLFAGVGLMATAVVVVGGSLLAMNGGARFLKEARLNKRANHRQRARPGTAVTPLPTLPRLEE